jgi:hypothetical protein
MSHITSLRLESLTSHEEVLDLRRQLLALHQQGSVGYYSAMFYRITSKLNWGEAALIVQYHGGLRKEIRDYLDLIHKPDTLAEYIDLAIRIDYQLYHQRDDKRKQDGLQKPQTQSAMDGMR